MAVIDSNSFNLTNVINEVYQITPPTFVPDVSLQDAFDNATGIFDYRYQPNSAGSKNNLLNFRNYRQNALLKSIQPYIAPDNFDFNTQPINIYSIYNSFILSNPNVKFICSVTDLATYTHAGIGGSGYSCTYGEEIRGVMAYTTSTTSYINWTLGSVKRHYLISINDSTLLFLIPQDVVWAYSGAGCNSISTNGINTTLKYVHVEDLAHVTSLPIGAFDGATSLTGIVHLPYIGTISNLAFRNCINITNINFSTSNNTIGVSAFSGCIGLGTDIDIINTINTINSYAFYNCTGVEVFRILNNTDAQRPGTNEGDFIINNNAFDNCTSLRFFMCYVKWPPILAAGNFTGLDASRFFIWVRAGREGTYQYNPAWSGLWSDTDDKIFHINGYLI